MLAVDYAFYVGAYLGTRTEDEFQKLSFYASAYIGEITMGRVPDDLETLSEDTALRVRLAFCAVLDAYGDQEPARSGAVASESNDGISVSYVTDVTLQRRQLYDAAAVYLGVTGLLYRGVNI